MSTPFSTAEAVAASTSMASAIARRGPDDSGVYIGASGRLGLAFRRLAIIDLSVEGHQPMHSASRRYTIVFNGEIYNFRELRARLEAEGSAPKWRGSSDTEVLLAAIEGWGLETTLARINGMFALALWDEREQSLQLARDRFGEKPLYLGWCGSTFLFGSELKALARHPHFRGEIDRGALAEFMRLGYIPAPLSIFRGVGKLLPGCFVSLDQRSLASGVLPPPQPYWSAQNAALKSLREPFRGSHSDAVEAVDTALRKAVGARTFADVPVGAFLSGGIDSSIVVAVMQACSSRPVHTFTIGNEDSRYDEASFSAAIAAHLGTRHEVCVVTANVAKDIIPQLSDYYCEPFADSSQIPTILVSRIAREQVKVALSGDGGDELFGGYNRHVWAAKTEGAIAALPSPILRFAGNILAGTSSRGWETVLLRLSRWLPGLTGRRLTSSHLQALREILQQGAHQRIYDALVGVSPRKRPPPPPVPLGESHGSNVMPDLLRAIMYFDTLAYLPDDIMTKVDRATMGENIEARAPFLDPNLFALAWSLPGHMLTDGRNGKLVLRQVLARYIPQELFERAKQGFAIPIGEWLRRDLADWAESLLDIDALRQDGYLDAEAIRAIWESHRSGASDGERPLWHALMFQAWLRAWRVSWRDGAKDETPPSVVEIA